VKQTRLVRLWGLAEETVAVGLLVAITAIVLVQVAGRYILTNPFIWTEEVTRLLLIWLTFVAGAAVTRRGLHISVDMFLRAMPTRSRILVAGLGECITSASFAGLAWLGAVLATQLGSLPLAATRWPMSVMVWPASVGCALIALYAGLRGVARLGSAATARGMDEYAKEFEESVRS
jgi:TRAP-type C4-dicarboxylate transport system permease small subunit